MGQRGGGGGGRLGAPGNWICPACSNENFANRTQCNRCTQQHPGIQMVGGMQAVMVGGNSNNTPRHQQMKPGDWMCPKCNNHNYNLRETCNKPGCDQGVPQGQKRQSRVGDPGNWICTECGNENFPARTECNIKTCQAQREACAEKRQCMGEQITA